MAKRKTTVLYGGINHESEAGWYQVVYGEGSEGDPVNNEQIQIKTTHMTIEQMIAEMQARILKLEKKVYELPPSIYNPFLESMPNPITHLHTHDPNKVAAWKNVPDDMLEDIPDINKVMADAALKPLIRDWEVIELGKPGTPIPRSQSLLTDEEIANGKGDILTVKRLSDNENFTVGHAAYLNNSSQCGPIREFRIHESGIMIVDTPNFNVPIGQLRRVIKSVERDWEVLEFRSNIDKGAWTQKDGEWISSGLGLFADWNNLMYGIESVEDGKIRIHSVRRTTDGQVFTVGDRERRFKIARFFIQDDAMHVEGDGWSTLLRTLVKAKHIFTTADCVEIFDGEDVYCFEPGGRIITNRVDNIDVAYEYGHYSTKAAAETAYKNHIGEQRLLSLDDVLECLGDVEKLEEIVKTRI